MIQYRKKFYLKLDFFYKNWYNIDKDKEKDGLRIKVNVGGHS